MMKTILSVIVLSTALSAQTKDVFVMFGTDITRPGSELKANYNIGAGYQFKHIEPTVSYTYENGGSGFLHSYFGYHTMTVGAMKNFDIPKTKKVAGYLWLQLGETSITGGKFTKNRLYSGYSFGIMTVVAKKVTIWTQVSLNKILDYPAYVSVSTGPAFSF